jgi:hypothetical protein
MHFLASETSRIPTLHTRHCPLEGSYPARSRSKANISKAEKGNTNTALLPLILLHQQLHLPFPDTTKQSLCPIRATLHVQPPSFHPRTPLANSTSRSATHPPDLHRLKMQLLALLTTAFTLLTLTSTLPVVDTEAVKDVVSSFSSFASPPYPNLPVPLLTLPAAPSLQTSSSDHLGASSPQLAITAKLQRHHVCGLWYAMLRRCWFLYVGGIWAWSLSSALEVEVEAEGCRWGWEITCLPLDLVCACSSNS